MIGSDGVWDVMSSAEVVGFVIRSATSVPSAAQEVAKEAVERWDLINEIGRSRLMISLENAEEARKKTRLERYDNNIMRDDITVVVCYLQGID